MPERQPNETAAAYDHRVRIWHEFHNNMAEEENANLLNDAIPQMLHANWAEQNQLIYHLDGGVREGFGKGPPSKDAQNLTPERHKAMDVALMNYEREKGALVPMREIFGRREGQYSGLLIKQKRESMTISEIVNTEIPIRVVDINGKRLREIASTIKNHGMKGDGVNTNITFTCNNCSVNTPSQYAFFCVGDIYCVEHLPKFEMCAACETLQNDCKIINTFDNRDVMVCRGCLTRNRRCNNCPNAISEKYVDVHVCQSCIDRGDDRTPYRAFSKGIKWVSKETGDIVKSSRMFSCEIEAFTLDREWGYTLCNTLPKEMGVTRDGSLESDEGLYGFEVQTPKLSGKKGEELIHHARAALKDIGATINDSCGMHVHLDGKSILPLSRREYPKALIQLMKTYVIFEDVIMSLLPFSRRYNDFCRPISETLQLAEIDTLTNVVEIEKVWYKGRTYEDIHAAKGHHEHASRYFGINLSPLLKEGHLEIRFHSGTTDARKILEWANLHALIMDACAASAFDAEFLREAQSTIRLTEKTTMLFNRIGMAETSKQFYRSRQSKFGNKGNEDDEVKKNKSSNRQLAQRRARLVPGGGAVRMRPGGFNGFVINN